MNITLNGEKEIINIPNPTITDLLKIKDVKMPDMVSVEYNGDMLEKDQFQTTTLKDGDEVEFLYFMGGGHLI